MRPRRQRDRLAAPTARLEALAREVATEIGVEPPRCRLLETHRIIGSVRPGRRGRPPCLTVTHRAIEELDPMALRWLVAHELGHLADRDGMRRWRRLGRIGLLASFASLMAIGAAPYPFGHVVALALVSAMWIAIRRTRRGMERAADRTANACCAADPDAGRRALVAACRSTGARGGRPFRFMQAVFGYPPWDERLRAADG